MVKKKISALLISSKMTYSYNTKKKKKLTTQEGMICTITDFNVPTRLFSESIDKHHFLNFYCTCRALEAISDVKDISLH